MLPALSLDYGKIQWTEVREHRQVGESPPGRRQVGKKANPEGLCPCYSHLDGLAQMDSIRPVLELNL